MVLLVHPVDTFLSVILLFFFCYLSVKVYSFFSSYFKRNDLRDHAGL